jgi:hypothetical protein
MAECNLLAYEVHVEFDVLGALVVHGIPRHVLSRDVVAEDYGHRVDVDAQLAEETPEP